MIDRPSLVVSALRSDRGPRPTNQDAVVSTRLPDGRWLAAVADGMGGLHDGDVASRTALEVLVERVSHGTALARAVEEANRAVVRRASGRPMGTTLVAAVIDGTGLSLTNVGDSRAYLLGPAGLVQVTRDHTVAAEAVERGAADAREIAETRWGKALTRSLGAEEVVEVDQFGPLRFDGGIRVLLCSDGVHGVLPDETIERCIRDARSVEEAAEELVRTALEWGSEDNVSAIVVQRAATGSTPPGQSEPQAARGDAQTDRPSPAPSGSDVEPDLGPAFVMPDDPAPYDVTRDPWDLALLVRRSHNPMRRKPGRRPGVYLVLALAVVVVVIAALLL